MGFGVVEMHRIDSTLALGCDLYRIFQTVILLCMGMSYPSMVGVVSCALILFVSMPSEWFWLRPKLAAHVKRVEHRFRAANSAGDATVARTVFSECEWLRLFGYQDQVLIFAGQLALLESQYAEATLYFNRAATLGKRKPNIEVSLGLLQAHLALDNGSEVDALVKKLNSQFSEDVFVRYRMDVLLGIDSDASHSRS